MTVMVRLHTDFGGWHESSYFLIKLFCNCVIIVNSAVSIMLLYILVLFN